MLLLTLFAFLAGIVTILSPCILPILPVVLSGSVGTGKRRPLGIVTGFVLSFTFFTLFLTVIVQATGLSADAVRIFSIITITFFGISLLIPQTQILLEQLFTKLSGLTQKLNFFKSSTLTPNTGFLNGLLIGISLGLLWTPCVGPILASVISLAITGTVTGAAFFITLAYSLGTAIPMLAIIQGGRQLLNKTPWLLTHTIHIQKAFGIIMILTALAIYFQVDRKFQTYILETFPQYGIGLTQFENNQFIQNQLEKLKQPVTTNDSNDLNDKLSYPLAPEFIPSGQWFNSEALTLNELKGKVVLVDFWTYTCINCIRTLPYLRTWHQKYADQGLVIIGVHSPEFEFEKNPDNLAKAIADYQLKYPIMQDNDFATWRAYNNRYWPAKYLIDKDGRIRYTHFGEGAYNQTEAMIQTLLKETGADVTSTINNPDYQLSSRTPELYLGYNRLEYLASPETILKDQPQTYTRFKNLPLHRFTYGGQWTIGSEYTTPSAGSVLQLRFQAQEIFLVIRPTTQTPGKFKLLLDNQLLDAQNASEDVNLTTSTVEVTSDRLYKLIKLPQSGQYTLTLEFLDSNLELYAFTFG